MRSWWLGVFGFLLCAGYWPGVASPAMTPRWALQAAVIPLALCFAGPIRLTHAHAVGFLFCCWAAFSLLWTPTWFDSVDAAWKLGLLATAFCLGSTLKDLRPLYAGMAIGIALSAIVALSQILGFRYLPEVQTPSGLFVNKNFLGEAAALVLIACVAHRMRWAIPGALLALMLAGARGAVLGVVFALAAWLWPKSKRLTAALLIAIAGLSVLMVVTGYGMAGIVARIAIWRDTLSGLTLTGHGFGSYYGLGPEYALHTDSYFERNAHAHNEILEIAFELGALGVLLALAFCGTLLKGAATPERLILVAVAVESLFEFPLHVPTTGCLAMLVAGHVARGLPVLWGETDRGGAIQRNGLARAR